MYLKFHLFHYFTTEEESFDWKSYLLDGEEEEIIGLPNQHYQVFEQRIFMFSKWIVLLNKKYSLQ